MIRLLSFIISLFTWGAVQLVTVDYTKDIYAPIAELNNHSLSEVFEGGNLIANGDFSDGTTGWTAFANIIDFTVINGVATFTGTGHWVNTYNNRLVNNDGVFSKIAKYYSIIKLKRNNDVSTNFVYLSQDGTAEILGDTLTTTYETYSAVYDVTSLDQTKLAISATNGLNISVDYVYTYNMTSLGIDNLSKEQMDVYYQQYLDNKDNLSAERFDVTVNDLTITDLVILISFSFGYVIVFLVIRKVVKKR